MHDLFVLCVRRRIFRLMMSRVAGSLIFILVLPGPCVTAQKAVSIPEEVEWTWAARPAQPKADLPNVLLLGDSISRNYFSEVTNDLAGSANVYLLATSASAGDPRLPRQISEFVAMERVKFSVVHFNNGMHGWNYTEAQFERALPSLVKSVRALVGKNGKLVWATITPVQQNAFNGATNQRIDARNSIAANVMQRACIPIDDQHALMMKHLDLYEDAVHFGSAGASLMGKQAALTIRAALEKKPGEE